MNNTEIDNLIDSIGTTTYPIGVNPVYVSDPIGVNPVYVSDKIEASPIYVSDKSFNTATTQPTMTHPIDNSNIVHRSIAQKILGINPLFFNEETLVNAIEALDFASYIGANIIRLFNDSIVLIISQGKFDEFIELLKKCMIENESTIECEKLTYIIDIGNCLRNVIRLNEMFLREVFGNKGSGNETD